MTDEMGNAQHLYQLTIAAAIRAAGVVVDMDPEDFSAIVEKIAEPLVVWAEERSLFSTTHKYLTAYKGLTFYTQTDEPLDLPKRTEVIEAGSIWIP